MHPIKLSAIAVTLGAMLLYPPARAAESAVQTATMILTNARVYTVNPQQPWAESVAIKDDEIVYVGDSASALNWAGHGTEILDLQGQMLLPGFHDSHLHLLYGGEAIRSCDLSEAYSAQSVRNTLLACGEAPGRGEDNWIIASVWNRTSFAGGEPPAGFLDELFPDIPVAVSASDGHSLWVNTRAMRIAGIDKNTLNPPNGIIFRDPVTAKPTGVLSGSAMQMLAASIPLPSLQENMQSIQGAIRMAHSLGITAAIEPGLNIEQAKAFHALAEHNALGMRLQLCLAPIGWEVDQFGLEVFDFLEQAPVAASPLLAQNCVKLFMDGALEANTAAMLEPYLGDSQPFPAFYELDELVPILRGLDERRVSAHVHAIGDAATRLALDGFAAIRPPEGFNARPVITHLQFVTAADIPRFGALGVAASITPYWMYQDELTLQIYPQLVGLEKSLGAYPVKAIADSGGRLLGSSDWSVSSMDPLLGIETAVTRQDPLSDNGNPLGESQKLDLATMIAAYTIDVAWAMGRDQETGSIEVGKKADLVVLDKNLFDLSPYDISNARVTRTLFGGETVWPMQD